MKKYKYLFWDLDGTILNSYEGCSKAFKLVFDKFGWETPANGYSEYIGPALRTSFGKYLTNEADMQVALQTFREYYLAYGVREACLYEGVENTLRTLKERGYTIYLATSKQEYVSKEILADYNVLEVFDRVFGADGNVGRNEKYQVLKYAIDEINVPLEESLMIGDSMYDVEGAKSIGMDCLAVLYGFGDRQELLNSKICASVEEPIGILDLLK